jgi:signal transduction histidine kinase
MGKWTIEVADNGIGMEEKYFKKIFKPFERLHSQSTFEGTGIGLAICKKIVQRHHGSIMVTSELQKGTTFKVSLPKKQPTLPT